MFVMVGRSVQEVTDGEGLLYARASLTEPALRVAKAAPSGPVSIPYIIRAPHLIRPIGPPASIPYIIRAPHLIRPNGLPASIPYIISAFDKV